MDLKMIGDKVLVKLMPMNNRMYKNLLYKPDTARAEELQYIGLVESFGNGIKSKKGQRKPLDLQLGDLITFARHTGVRMMIENVEYRVIRANEIIAILEE